jgi:hypothetical protein
MNRLALRIGQGLVLAGVLAFSQAHAQDKPVYRCPGNLYTDALSAKDAAAKGCKTLEGAPITVIQSQMPRVAPRATASPGSSGGEKVSSQDQRARDADSRNILEAELRKEEEALAALKKEYKNGEPDRLGDERNYQKYLDRVAAMKAAITRKEADVASIKRELSKLGGGSSASSSGSGGGGSNSGGGSTGGNSNVSMPSTSLPR